MPTRVTCCKCFHTTFKFECPKCEHKTCLSCKPPPVRRKKDKPPPVAEGLIPPDLERCQAEWSSYNAFVMGGPTRTSGRCEAKPEFVAAEKDVGSDGKRGSMTVCADCRKILEKQVADGKAPPVVFTKLLSKVARARVQARTVTVKDEWGHTKVVGGFGDVGGKR